MAGRVAYGADDADRGADDQSAWAGHDQQGQPPVKPAVGPGVRAEERLVEKEGGNGGDQDGQHNDSRGIVAGKAINEPLGRGAFFLGFFHHFDEAADGVIGGQAGDLNLQRPLAVDAAGEDFRTGLFFHQLALAGNGRLVDRRSPGHDPPIHGDALPRLD